MGCLLEEQDKRKMSSLVSVRKNPGNTEKREFFFFSSSHCLLPLRHCGSGVWASPRTLVAPRRPSILAGSLCCAAVKQKKRYTRPEAISKPTLPQDFVEKQKAYFAEIDAFELPEEVVSESELE